MSYVIQTTDDPPFVTCTACEGRGEYQAEYCGACDGHGEIALDMTALAALSHNLSIAAGLCAAFSAGWDECIESEDTLRAYEEGHQTHAEHETRLANLWQPGCGKVAP